MRSVICKFVVVLTASMAFAGPAQARYVVLGHIDLSFYEATAAVVQQILERLGYNVATKKGPHSQMYPLLGAGEVDLLVAAWLPNAHGSYWAQYQNDVFQVSMLYEDARLFWAVPEYVPESEVTAVADLTKPAVVARMDKIIRGPGADSGLMIGSKKILEDYKLGQAGYRLAPGAPVDWVAWFNRNIEQKNWFVTPLWQPQYLNQVTKLRILEEPKLLLGGPDRAYLVAHNAIREKLDKRTLSVLGKLELSVKWVTELDYMVSVEKLSPQDAARRWIASHPETVTYWLMRDE